MSGKNIIVSETDLAVTCDAAVTWDELFTELEETGFRTGIYPMASGKIALGEWAEDGIPSNIGSYRFGTINEQVRSMGVELSDGSVIETGFPALSNFSTGYNLNALFAGSRRALGKITGVTLKLHPKMPVSRPAGYGFASSKELFESLARVVKSPVTPYNISVLFVIQPENVAKASLEIMYEGSGELVDSDQKAVEQLLAGHTKESETASLERWGNRFSDLLLEALGAGDAVFLGDWPVPVTSSRDFVEDLKGLGGFSRLIVTGVLTDRSTIIFGISAVPQSDESAGLDAIEEKLMSACDSRNGFPIQWDVTEKGEAKDGFEMFISRMDTAHGRGGLELGGAIKNAIDPQNAVGKNEHISRYTKQSGNAKLQRRGGLFSPIREDMSETLRKALVNMLGEDKVCFEEFEMGLYTHDLAPLPNEIEVAFHRVPAAVVRPKTTEDIIRLVKFAKAHKIPVVPRGGGSWGFGGAVPTQGGIVVDFTSMNKVIEVDEVNMLLTCQPGTTWEQAMEEAGRKGLSIGAYPGSYPVATVGGWLSTGGSGIASYRHGVSFDQVRSVSAVTGEGSVLVTAPKSVGASGYFNFTSMFSGAEGTTGLLTEITLKLHPRAEELRPSSYIFAELEDIGGALGELVKSPVCPYHVSFIDGNHFRFLGALGLGGSHAEIPAEGGVVNVVFEGSKTENDWGEGAVDAIMKKHGGRKEHREFAEHEWSERAYELRARRLGPGGVLGEVVVPVGSFTPMVRESRKIIKQLKMESSINGVVVDRNTIVFMPYFISDERMIIKSLSSMGYVKKLIDAGTELGGRPSGLGIWFAGNLEKLHGSRGARLLRDLKYALDPDDILNPGKHTEIRTRWGIALPPFLMDSMLKVMGIVKMGLSKDELNHQAGAGHS
jgi:glycolate oxidase